MHVEHGDLEHPEREVCEPHVACHGVKPATNTQKPARGSLSLSASDFNINYDWPPQKQPRMRCPILSDGMCFCLSWKKHVWHMRGSCEGHLASPAATTHECSLRNSYLYAISYVYIPIYNYGYTYCCIDTYCCILVRSSMCRSLGLYSPQTGLRWLVLYVYCPIYD